MVSREAWWAYGPHMSWVPIQVEWAYSPHMPWVPIQVEGSMALLHSNANNSRVNS